MASQTNSPGHGLWQGFSLCSYCEQLLNRWPGRLDLEKRQLPHHGTQNALFTSANDGCSLCAQFCLGGCRLVSLEDTYWTNIKELGLHEGRIELWPHDVQANPNCWRRASLLIPESTNNDGTFTARPYWRYEVAVFPAAASDTGPLKRLSLSTEDALPLVNRWLDKCRTSHIPCIRTTNLNYCPTRLIDISRDEPYLCLGASLKKPIHYSTLSHCWGAWNAFRVNLTKDRLESFLHRIPPNALSKTFRDFIKISRFLGIQYVWIDSLCIIQDDSRDWELESARMTDVYGECMVNIAAAGAADGDVGCFFDRGTTWRCSIKLSPENSEETMEFVPLHFNRILSRSPLASRGWALQERILPRRTLFFTKTQVFWECKKLQACEIFPEQYPSWLRQQKLSAEAVDEWEEIVAIYSGCSLTFSKDKLVALSGLARLMQQKSGIKYAAGLWLKDFPPQLMWQIFDQASKKERPVEYRAPSWSWASLDGDMSFVRFAKLPPKWTFVFHVAVHRLSIQPLSTDNPFGKIIGATLSLRCDFFYCGKSFRVGNASKARNIFVFDLPEKMAPVDVVTLDCINDLGGMVQDLYLLPILHYITTSGLVLKQTGNSRGQYSRVGTFSLRDNDNSLCEVDFCSLPDDKYSEVHIDEQGKIRRVIDII